MGYANVEKSYWASQSLAADLEGESIDVRSIRAGVFSLEWSDAAATDAVVKLQESADGTNWHDIASQTKTIDDADGVHLFKLTADVLLSPWVRAVIDHGAETDAVATMKYFLKGDR